MPVLHKISSYNRHGLDFIYRSSEKGVYMDQLSWREYSLSSGELARIMMDKKQEPAPGIGFA
jgi:hypothetical protein